MGILEDYIKVQLHSFDVFVAALTLVRLQHLEDGKSMIMRLVGLHRISYGSDKVWVLVMGNTFPTFVTMNEIFDLKVCPTCCTAITLTTPCWFLAY